jgi:hypothetical protein
MATNHHYVLGAGLYGCLYDFGPEQHETLEDALESADRWLHVDVDDAEVIDVGEVTHALKTVGIYHFSRAETRRVFGDYIQVSKLNGPIDSEDE